MDLLIPHSFLFLFGSAEPSRFMPAARRKYSLASAAPPRPRHCPPISRLFFFICDCPPLLTGFALSLLFQPGLISPIGTASPCSFTPSRAPPPPTLLERLFVVKIAIYLLIFMAFSRAGYWAHTSWMIFAVRCKDYGVLKVLCKLRFFFFSFRFFLFALGREKKKALHLFRCTSCHRLSCQKWSQKVCQFVFV